MPKKVLKKKSIMNTKTNVDQNNQQDTPKLESYRQVQTPVVASGSSYLKICLHS